MIRVIKYLKRTGLILVIGLLLCLPSVTSVEGGTGNKDPENPLFGVSAKDLFRYEAQGTLSVQQSEVRAGLLYDAVNRKIVWQKNPDVALPIASLTKMMVALLVVEDLRAGEIAWTDTLTWEKTYVAGRRYHRKRYTVVQKYSLADAFKATMVASDNECSEQLARFISNGDLSKGVERMNRRAKELGMRDTYYGNPSGLPAATVALDNSSTPIDQLVLALELLKYEEVLQVTGLGYAQVHNGRTVCMLRNHNGLAIKHTGDVDGLKTGYTRRAGFCLVGTTEKCGHRLISIVLGCRGPQIRNEVVRQMFCSYYTSIGLDPIGEYCPAPPQVRPVAANVIPASDAVKDGGAWVMVNERVRKAHVVRRGETLSGIASGYGVSMKQLRSWNPGKIPASGTVYVGQSLKLYASVARKVWVADSAGNTAVVAPSNKPSAPNTAKAKPIASSVPSPKGNGYIYHTVVPGDTLFSIARKYGLPTVDLLKDLNGIDDPKSIRPGMKLKVKVKS
jgi:D-alanyl-D-alanine carboxypeptidase (penicillin-binding protein 5/6)